jgi:hypothetical protein
MKKLMIIMLMVLICNTAMAGLSSDDFQSIYDDLLEFLNFEDDDSATSSDLALNIDDTRSATNQYPLRVTSGDSGASEGTVITNPEPCSIILSSIGLGVVGYLKRRRAI